MGNEVILAQLFDDKILKVLALLFDNRSKEFYLQEIANSTKVPIASTYRILIRLARLGIVELVQVSRFKLYRLVESEETKKLENIIIGRKTPIELFIQEIRGVEGIEEVILHGEETRQGANIVLIGSVIDSDKVKSACSKIKESYNFSVTALSLTKEQFGQMNAMGLFPKNQKSLYKNYK